MLNEIYERVKVKNFPVFLDALLKTFKNETSFFRDFVQGKIFKICFKRNSIKTIYGSISRILIILTSLKYNICL